MSEFRRIAGIAWDDEPEYLQEVQKILDVRNRVSFRLTKDLVEFRQWIHGVSYDFAILDIFQMHAPVAGQANPAGLNLCVDLRMTHPDIPIVLATDLFDTIPGETLAKWNLGAATFVWSKAQRENWFARDIVLLLEREGLFVQPNSLLVLGDLAALHRRELEHRLEELDIVPTFLRELGMTRSWAETEARIRHYAGFLVIALPGPQDQVALDVGRLLSMPRGRDRLIVACPKDAFSTLTREVAGDNEFGLRMEYDDVFEVTDDLINRIRLLLV